MTERVNPSLADIGRPPSLLAEEFPGVKGVLPGLDEEWWPSPGTAGEPMEVHQHAISIQHLVNRILTLSPLAVCPCACKTVPGLAYPEARETRIPRNHHTLHIPEGVDGRVIAKRGLRGV